jgi:hypothetical protein
MEAANRALAALLGGLVDYAGLFPPASLDMRAAAERYARHRSGLHRPMLGRFVVPASRLDELAGAAAAVAARAADDATRAVWPLSALVSPPFETGLERVARFNERQAAAAEWKARVEAVEAKVATAEEAGEVGRLAAARGLELFVEVPVHPWPAALVAALAPGARAKVRTGGTTPEAFPDARHLAGWLARCAAERLPFKATAGLHHPLRGEHPAGGQRGAARMPMHGFLNVFLAAALLYWRRIDEAAAAALLDERDPRSFTFNGGSASWDGCGVTTAEIAEARRFALGFGSCSVDEPIEGLTALGLIADAPTP